MVPFDNNGRYESTLESTDLGRVNGYSSGDVTCGEEGGDKVDESRVRILFRKKRCAGIIALLVIMLVAGVITGGVVYSLQGKGDDEIPNE